MGWLFIFLLADNLQTSLKDICTAHDSQWNIFLLMGPTKARFQLFFIAT